MTNTVIGYSNIYRGAGTVAASSDPAATPKENALDWRLEDYWQPAAATFHTLDYDHGSATPADYLAFYSSDLYLQAGAKVELFSGASSPAATLEATITPTTRGPKLLRFDSANFQHWRIKISTTGSYAPKLQILNAGVQLELQRGLRTGFMPPALASRNKPVTNISENGLFLGRSLAVAPVEFNLQTTTLTAAWVRANWPALLAHLEQFPAFILPEPDGYPDESIIAWTNGKITQPSYSHAAHLSLNVKMRAFL